MTFNSTGNVVDGMINNWAEDGEPRQDLPEDAVQEFKVSNAQLQGRVRPGHRRRRAGGDQVGHQQLRGTAFEYFRNKSAERDRASSRPRSRTIRRDQFGGSVGGPIVREPHALLRAPPSAPTPNEFYTVRTGQPQFYSVGRGHVRAAVDRNLYSARVRLADQQRAVLLRPLRAARTSRDLPGLRRHQRLAAGYDETCRAQSLVVGHTWMRGTRQLNDFRFQYAHAAFYGYSGRHRACGRRGDVPGRARQPPRRATTAFRR